MREKGRSQRDWIGRAGEGSGKGEGERSRWECGRGGVREDPEGGSGWWVPSRGICWRDRPLETEETVDRRFSFAEALPCPRVQLLSNYHHHQREEVQESALGWAGQAASAWEAAGKQHWPVDRRRATVLVMDLAGQYVWYVLPRSSLTFFPSSLSILLPNSGDLCAVLLYI